MPCRPPSNCSTSSRAITCRSELTCGSGIDLRQVLRGRGQLADGTAGQEIADDDPPRNYREIGGQAALPAEVPQHGKVVANDGQKDLGTKVVAVFAGKPHACGIGRCAGSRA